ncbi:MAG: sigma-70 family RNA polymerase sigma factor [Planctomycetota bacterium]
MSRASQFPTPEMLRAHGRFVRRIACGLLRDEHLAEDVAQSTWLALLERPPRDRGRLRSWLGTVARNIALRVRRAEGRRSRREAVAVRSAVNDSASPERELMLRSVVDAVLGLREPYRSTILMRFYENLSIKEMAAREQLPEDTVRSRMRRALAQLRERLEYEHRDSWAVTLAVLAGLEEVPIAAPAAAWGVLAMSVKLKIVLLAVPLLVVAGLFLRSSLFPGSEVVPVASPSPLIIPHSDDEPRGLLVSEDNEASLRRERLQTKEAAPGPSPPQPEGLFTAAGRRRTLRERPVGGRPAPHHTRVA